MIPPEKTADMALEVVALRAENEALRLELGDWINDQADKVARLADAEAEIERLRELFRDASFGSHWWFRCNCGKARWANRWDVALEHAFAHLRREAAR